MGGMCRQSLLLLCDYLPLGTDAIWTVYDLPENIRLGRAMASDRNACNLQFTYDMQKADKVYLLIVSGSLHYFDKPLPEFIENIKQRPRYIPIKCSWATDLNFAILAPS